MGGTAYRRHGERGSQKITITSNYLEKKESLNATKMMFPRKGHKVKCSEIEAVMESAEDKTSLQAAWRQAGCSHAHTPSDRFYVTSSYNVAAFLYSYRQSTEHRIK